MSDGSFPPVPLLDRTLARQKTAFLRKGPPGLEQRRKRLRALKAAILRDQDAFISALNADFGHRARQETRLFDLISVTMGIDKLVANLARWLAHEKRDTALVFQPATNSVVWQPLGVVGVISPWNYPVALALMPLATAIAAGNRVMLKPSEVTPRTAEQLRVTLASVFDEEEVAVVTGDASVGIAFTKLDFDHLVFTGSTAVGKAVMRAAAETLTPVTLELGGKSPVILGPQVHLEVAARRIAWGKLANAGQTCIAPDYALVQASDLEALVAGFSAAVDSLYPDILSNPDYSSVISDRHLARLRGLISDAENKGARVIRFGVDGDPRATHPRTLAPALVLDVTPDMAVMKEEIFGPILPVMTYCAMDQAIAEITSRPRPLALYYFGPESEDRRNVLARTLSGGVSLNDTILHYAQDDLPFGGVGPSGMGAYHSREGVRALSHGRAIFSQSPLSGADLIRPPYGQAFDRAMGVLAR